MGREVCIYNPVREKKHCGRRDVLAMSAFMSDAAVARHATSSPPWPSPSPHRFNASGSACGCSRPRWRSACAMRVNCSAPGCCQGTPAHPKTAQRQECDALGRETCARAGTRGVDRFSKTAITRRCAVWECFLGPRERYTADAQNRLPQRSRESARQRASRLAVKVT